MNYFYEGNNLEKTMLVIFDENNPEDMVVINQITTLIDKYQENQLKRM